MKSVTGVINLTVKGADCESDLSPPCNAEVNVWSHAASPPYPYVSLIWCLIKYRDNSILSLEK
jgi:hypothetical protein